MALPWHHHGTAMALRHVTAMARQGADIAIHSSALEVGGRLIGGVWGGGHRLREKQRMDATKFAGQIFKAPNFTRASNVPPLPMPHQHGKWWVGYSRQGLSKHLPKAWQCNRSAMALPCHYHGTATALANAMPLPWHRHGTAMALPWPCHGTIMALPCQVYGSPMAVP